MVAAADNGEVQVWRVDLDQPDETVEAATAFLSPAELQRADRGTPPVRRRRILARAALRYLLAACRNSRPEDVPLMAGAFGKPTILERQHTSSPYFNASTSGDSCLVALTCVGPVGVDIERSAALEDIEPLAPRFLATVEAELIDRLPDELKARALLRHWTYKEAYVKATGLGLSTRLDRVVVSDHATRPVIVALDDDDPAAWTVIPLSPEPTALAAVVVRVGDRGRPPAVRLRTMAWPFEQTSPAARAFLCHAG